MGEWPVAGGVFLRSRFKGPKRESRGGIFHRYPPHEPAQAIVLACILHHVGATHDDIAHRKLPRWYEPSFYHCALRLRPARSGNLNARPSLTPSFNRYSVWERDIIASPRNFARGDLRPQTSSEKRENCVKISSASVWTATSRFNPVFCEVLDIANCADCLASWKHWVGPSRSRNF